jgi:hypothetical protein
MCSATHWLLYSAVRCNSNDLVHVMGHVPYVGWATRSRATTMTRFMFVYKKKKGSSQYHKHMMIKHIHVKNSIKLELIKLSINIWIVPRQIENLKRHDYGFNRALTKVLAPHNSDENHPNKKITRKKRKKKIEKTLLEVAFDHSQSFCVSYLFRSLFIGIRRIVEAI